MIELKFYLKKTILINYKKLGLLLWRKQYLEVFVFKSKHYQVTKIVTYNSLLTLSKDPENGYYRLLQRTLGINPEEIYLDSQADIKELMKNPSVEAKNNKYNVDMGN